MAIQKLEIKDISDSGDRNFFLLVEGGLPPKIGMHRPEAGHKPCLHSSKDGALTLICVGHLYARRAKTFAVAESLEILSEEYAASGVAGVQKAIGGGMFALFVIDSEKGSLTAFTDFMACMPLFFASGAGSFRIGVNQFDLAGEEKPSELACAEYLMYGYLPFHASLFPGMGRIGPGQTVSCSFDAPGKFELSAERLPSYPVPAQRVRDEKAAIERLDALFTAYFARLGNEPISAGLSGGYDSRLIAAYCRNKPIRLVTFDNPNTKEARNAKLVARTLGLSTNVFQIPADAPSRFSDDFLIGTGTADSLESSHMYGNLDMLCKNDPAYIIDGHLGDTVVGGGYFYKLKLRSEPIHKILFGQDRYQLPLLPDSVYLSRLSSGYGRKIPGLPGSVEPALEEYATKSLAGLISRYKAYCHTDADMIELLLYYFRGSLLISGGPISFMRRAPTLCPFYDYDIFTTCMGISKTIRAGDRLYNAFYRRKFPELCDISKENTGGKAKQSVFSYRVTHLRNSLYRKLVERLPGWMQKGGNAGGNTDTFLENYVKDPSNKAFFGSVLAKADKAFADNGLSRLIDPKISEADLLMFLRYNSLAFLLQGRAEAPKAKRGKA